MADLTPEFVSAGQEHDRDDLISILNHEAQAAIQRVAEQLNLSTEPPTGPQASARYRLVCQAYQARRERAEIFDADLFADPAWDILLALFCGHLAERPMTIQDAVTGAAVPDSTARRWLAVLERRGLISITVLADRVELTTPAIEKLEAYVERLRRKSLMRVI